MTFKASDLLYYDASDPLGVVDGVLEALDHETAFTIIADCIKYEQHQPARVYSMERREWYDVVTRRCATGCVECAHMPQTESGKSGNESDKDENDDFSV